MTGSDSPSLPLRWPAGSAPQRLPVPIPPERLALFRGGRPLKRWRYVAAFDEQIMLCAAVAAVGPGRSSWWAVWDRRRGILAEHTSLYRHGLARFADGGRVQVADRGVTIDITVDEGGGVESLNAHEAQYVWTRKQAARRARGRVVLEGEEFELDGLAVVDDTAGYHARETEWWWSAGVGQDSAGEPVGWNLVAGVNDGPADSERSVWRSGVAAEVGPVRFEPGLTALSFAEGGALAFEAEAVRLRRDAVIVVRSDYRQPFGRYSGALPGVGRLHGGLGVMEHHVARW
ncbi:MAG TPA: DUF2804 family protein [Solirubrobacteraceae bacterium]|nr:DUF2804 family protein [Solirubrobacteraceae bacterium]